MKNRFLKTSFFFLTFHFFMIQVSLAGSIGGTGGLEGGFLVGWVENVIRGFILLSGVVAVAVLISNAYLFITASGDEGKVQKATKGITNAIIGLIIAAIAFLIVHFVIDSI